MTGNNHLPLVAPRTSTVTRPRICDPVEAAMETAARLRVMERLLQNMLAAETSDNERCSLLLRYNRQRQELFERLDDTPHADQVLPEQKQLEAMIAGPLQHPGDHTALKMAANDIRQMIGRLLIF